MGAGPFRDGDGAGDGLLDPQRRGVQRLGIVGGTHGGDVAGSVAGVQAAGSVNTLNSGGKGRMRPAQAMLTAD